MCEVAFTDRILAMSKQPRTCGRQISIPGMAYAPTVELGVVYLFGRLAPKLGFTVESVHPHFPDCSAKYKGKTVRIEFEFRASHYANHPPRGADVIVCWENDWAHRPKAFQHLKIISLKPWVNAQRRVFMVGCNEEISGEELRARTVYWSVPSYLESGDLVLIYRKHPTAAICDVWEAVSPPEFFKKGNKQGFMPGYQARIRCVARLSRPITYEMLKKEKRTKDLAVVRKRFQGKSEITQDWPLFHDLIVSLNPKLKTALRDYAD